MIERMKTLLRVASEINELWRQCLMGAMPSQCPSNEAVAAIIGKHLQELESREEEKDKS